MANAIVPPSPGVYRLHNSATGKSYVGSSKNLRVRGKEHLRRIVAGDHHSGKVRSSARKHGAEAFTFEVLELCAAHDLLTREAHWMALFDSVRNGYNVRADPSTNIGVRPTTETCKKLSAARKGKKMPVETRAKLSAATQGRDMSVQVRVSADRRRGSPLPAAVAEKIAAALKGRPKSPEHVAKVAAANVGRVASEATRRRISEAQIGRKPSEAAVAKWVGVKQSAETIEKRVAKLRGRPQSDEHVAKRMAAWARTTGRDPQEAGVSWHKGKQKWRVRVRVDGREVSLGYFTDKADALAARAGHV